MLGQAAGQCAVLLQLQRVTSSQKGPQAPAPSGHAAGSIACLPVLADWQ